MAAPWVSDAYNALDVSRIQGGPHDMPQKFIEWFPRFFGTTVTSARDHVDLFMDTIDAYAANEHEDVVLKLFAKSQWTMVQETPSLVKA